MTMSTRQRQVSDILRAASHLLDSEAGQDRNLKSVLNTRLDNFYASLSKDRPFSVGDTVEGLRLETAQCALETVEQVNRLLDANVSTSAAAAPGAHDMQDDDAPVIGSRDLTQLRTLLSIVFRWSIDPLLARVSHALPSNHSRQVGTRVVELGTPEDYHSLSSLLLRLAAILLPCGPRGRLPHTPITTAILDRHFVDFTRASITLGWLPKSLSSTDALAIDDLRPVVLRLLESVSLSQVVADLGAILSGEPPPAHVRRICSNLLSKSLLRERGVNALLTVVFGEGDAPEEPSLEKYEHVGRILKSIPAGMAPEAYFATVIPGILRILSEDVPATYKRAASFSIARMLDPEFPHKKYVTAQMLPILHHPLRPSIPQGTAALQSPHSTATSDGSLRPSQALLTIRTLLLNSDPSPVFIALILSPISPYLYALLYYLDKTRTSDPVVRDLVKVLLTTWGRVVECQEGIEQLWLVLHGQRVSWWTDDTGEVVCTVTESQMEKLALLSPERLRGKEYDVYDDAFDLYPNPTHFVRYIKSLNRSDISCELFVRLLEEYRSAKSDRESNPMRVLLYLQIIMQMQEQLAGDSSPQSILKKPEYVLQFVKHALEPSSTKLQSNSGQSLGLADLRIIPEDEPSIPGDSDSDDEGPEGIDSNPDEDMPEIAINLLLATLEANPNLSARDTPILGDVFALLDPYASSSSPSIRGAVREARMVMTARLASASAVWNQPQAKGESSQEVYQKALKLLQDPILPVRAHGLLLLRQLVAQYSRSSSDVASAGEALVPAILSIFMQAVQEDDSYIFLNAVQGLVGMVDTFGKGVLNSLLETYTHNLTSVHGGYLTKQEVDTRVRVGEALGQVIRRCGDTLGMHVDVIMPRLVSVFRARQAPVVLRASAVALLTQCVKTSFAAVAGYTSQLSAAMIDLLQVEMVVPSGVPSANDNVGHTKESMEANETLRPDPEIDSTPTAVDPKLPSLRRSALHFLTLLMRTVTQAMYEESLAELPSISFLRRAKATLGYASSADEDGITRAMAREADESINQLMKTMLGIE
ncbi:hypothetical protein F5J12DRAFT_909233 [Pisolithus orientalis]|uniref:uncharacterized protein n=1 Tax=Pisolithus orientalis TaxID=936130 RepID=UPI0022257B1A|nr:uncharacterized protein F5J12DRAFT_909233 [Pisolithus orientalis]KAI6035338.1 hypothetical protein F5J12DRAFT_909233 [Pisolithus orientalis]